MENREKKLINSTFLIGLGTFFQKIGVLITLPVLTSCLSKSEYGVYDLVLTISELILPIATLTIQSAAFRFLLDCKSEKEKGTIISSVFAVAVSSCFIAAALFCIIPFNIAPGIKLSIAVYFLFMTLTSVNKDIVRGLYDKKAFVIGQGISSFVQIILVFVFVKGQNSGLFGAIIAIAAGMFLSSCYLLFKGNIISYIRLSDINKDEIKRMLSYSAPLIPNSMSHWVMHASDRLVLSIVIGTAANAAYAVANKIPSILNLVNLVFGMSWTESASVSINDKDFASYYSNMFDKFFNFVSGCMVGLVGLVPWLFKLLISEKYSDVYPHVLILCMAIYFFTVDSFFSGIYIAIKKSDALSFSSLAAAACNLIIDILLVKKIGIYAASISTLISYLLLLIYRMAYIVRRFKLTVKYKKILLYLLLIICQCFVCGMRIDILNYISLIFGVCFAVCININFIKDFLKMSKGR